MARAEIRDLRSQVEALKICKFGLERFSTDNDINIDYFMVGECVRFLFTSCEGSRKRTSERSLTILHNE